MHQNQKVDEWNVIPIPHDFLEILIFSKSALWEKIKIIEKNVHILAHSFLLKSK